MANFFKGGLPPFMQPQQPQHFDLHRSRALRDEGMQAALIGAGDDWKPKAYMIAIGLPVGWKGLGEDIRRMCLDAGCAPPADKPNAWGGFIAGLLKGGHFERVEEWGQPRAKPSHASAYRMIERVTPTGGQT